MKVVLKQDVKSIGKKDGMYEVSDGYARNFLFPRKLAVPADAAAVNEVKTKAAAVEHHAAEELAAAQALAGSINGKSVTIKDIAEAVGKAFGQTLDKRKIVLDGDIKNFGTYEVDVKVYPKVTAKIKVNVEE